MGRVQTNNTGLAYVVETALGVPDTTGWVSLEPNSIGTFGATITTVARQPISPNRQRRKGTVTDLDSAVDFESDLTLSAFRDFAEAFVFVTGLNTDVTGLAATAAANASGDYTLSSALIAAQLGRLVTDTAGSSLIWVSGFSTAANNGLKAVDVDATASTTLSVSDTLTDESGATARISFAGHRIEAAEAITWTWSSPQATLGGTGLGTLLAALNLTAGQIVHIGSIASAGGAIQNAFDDAGTNDAYGYCRVVSVSANAVVFDKVDATLQKNLSDPGVLDVLFGEYIRNVSVSDSEYLTRSYTFEASFPNLGDGTAGNTDDAWQYAHGNYCSEMTLNLPLTDKATASFAFIGTDTDNPTTTQATGASSASSPDQTAAFNTSSDIARLRVQETDEDGLSSCIKSASLTLRNNVSAEKCLGTLGATFVNTGLFEVDLDLEMLFTNPLVIDAIRANDTVTMDFVVKNDDGVIAVDIPSMTMGGGGRGFPVNESVTISTTAQAFQDTTLATSIGISLMPVPLP